MSDNMKRIKISSLRVEQICVLFILQLFVTVSYAALNHTAIPPIKFKQLSIFNTLPTDEIQKIYQDKDGFMWFATRNGLGKYDGYQTTLYKSNLYSPGLLTNNNVYCLADDNDHKLWIGTQEGVNVLDKKTGKFRKYLLPDIPHNVISCMLVTKDNNVWVGTDNGLCRYDRERDSFVVYTGELTGGVLNNGIIKALYEDSEGDLWIGTWDTGLYRYSPAANKFYAYPEINDRNSAHVIYEDTNKAIWIGSWARGLFKIRNPKDMEPVSYISYHHMAGDENSLSDDVVYDICEDFNTHSLWIGTRSGLSIMKYDEPGTFINYMSKNAANHIPCDEINSIVRDSFGNMWIGSIGGGVMMADTRRPLFSQYNLNLMDKDIPTTSVRALFVDSEHNLWMGIGTYGLACQKYATGQLITNSHIPEFSEITSVPTVYSIIQRKKNNEIWFGTYDGGLFIYQKGEKVKNLYDYNCDFLTSSCVSALFEDTKENCWVGTRGGLGVSRADGTSYKFGLMDFGDGLSTSWIYVRDIIEDIDHSIWLATGNMGLIHITGDINEPSSLKFRNYSYRSQKLQTNSVLCLHIDQSGNMWAGTEGGGLYLYSRKEKRFEEKNHEYNIPGDMVGCIEEDERGNLWLGTNAGLVKLSVKTNEKSPIVRVYTSADGLQDNFFIANSSCSWNGELFFGGYKGYNSFFPDNMEEYQHEVPFLFTDIKIFNRSFSTLPPEVRTRISSCMPSFTEKIELPYEYNNFSIEFAALTYKNPELNQYAYRLEGFDKEWQYTGADRRFAYYNNLESGTYKFQLKATNENGIWSGYIRELTVIVHPPFWVTWWAYLIYGIMIILVCFYLYRTAKNRILLQNELRLKEMDKAKAEELNHAKLQFFTNITHELLTPLTIISATVDELKMQAPNHDDLYAVIGSNIRRLIRLLQQILEFRKAETGNLKLRVSPGDIAAFVKNEAESFRPLIKKRKIHFSVLCDPDSIVGYFDTDKLDKILYNLLSNAAKYSQEGGYIQVTVSYSENKDFILLRIKDNGKGISKEKQKTLFQRFYEGDYRKFNTIGTGIGLSLTKDLVELHGGSIAVESEVDKGTEFIVALPIDRSYFKEEQIDDDVALPAPRTIDYEDNTGEINEAVPLETKTNTILVIEDNEELLQLMVRLLRRDYNVFTAENGKEAVVVLENEDIDLIVSDVMMPEMDGIQFCKYVKNNLEISHIPVILLTAKNKEEDRAEAYEVGADAFISKPFNLAVLHARIRNLLKYKERMAWDFKKQLVFEVKDMNYTSIDEDFMQRAIDCVNHHLDDCSFDQTQFVEEMNTSKSTLYKKLKSLTGLNTSAFIRNIRLKAACRIMEEKGANVRVSELAYAVGFNDPKYFSSCFKKEFGMLPSEYIDRFLLKEG